MNEPAGAIPRLREYTGMRSCGRMTVMNPGSEQAGSFDIGFIAGFRNTKDKTITPKNQPNN
jgi:hypothetical protein